jgi:ATPase family AAA domain-containing protein 3A/B
MSWLFGYKSKQPEMPQPPPENPGNATAGQASGDQQLTKAERKAMEAYRFDSSALERAAEAAKTLERSSKFMIMQYS